MHDASNAQKLAGMISGYWVSQSIHVAAKLGLADALADGPKTVEALAAEVSAHAPTLYRLLRALASVGVFSEDPPRTFRLTPLAQNLRRDVPGSQWAMAVMMGDEHYQAWGGLLDSVRDGSTAFDRLYGKPIFEYLAEKPEQARIFDAAMTAIHGRETQAMLKAYKFVDVCVIADIGGGNASNLIETLTYYPEMHGILFDLPHVVERAAENVKAAALEKRCQWIGGDFFAEIPVRADAYFLRHILHDWDDEKATRILRNIRASIPRDGRLLVVEHVLPRGDTPSFGKLLDLNMLIMPGGVERTEEEFDRLYAASGFKLTRVVATDGDLCVVEGAPA